MDRLSRFPVAARAADVATSPSNEPTSVASIASLSGVSIVSAHRPISVAHNARSHAFPIAADTHDQP